MEINNSKYQDFDNQMIQMFNSPEAKKSNSVFDLAALFDYFGLSDNWQKYTKRFEAICENAPIISSKKLLSQNNISGQLQSKILSQVHVDDGILMYETKNIKNNKAIPITDYQMGQFYQAVIEQNRKDA